MTIRATFPTDRTQSEEARIAAAILAGDFSQIPAVEYETFDRNDWTRAAEYAVDSEDYSEIRWMLDKEAEDSREEVALYAREVRNFRKSWLAPLGGAL